jgi:hypothetical protein
MNCTMSGTAPVVTLLEKPATGTGVGVGVRVGVGVLVPCATACHAKDNKKSVSMEKATTVFIVFIFHEPLRRDSGSLGPLTCLP